MINKFFVFLKDNKKYLAVALVTNIILVLIMVSIITVVIHANRAAFFDYFAKQYLAQMETGAADGFFGNTKNKNDRLVFSDESAIIAVTEKADPAVVSIVVTKDVPIVEQYYERFNPFGSDFFGDGFSFRIPQYREKGTEKRESGGGSGFFIAPDGLLITNRHVVDDTDAEYTVLTNDGKKHEAEVLARDTVLDIAVLKVAGDNFRFLEFGDSDALKPGQTVIAIGNALAEFRNSVSVGVVSGLSRSIVAGNFSGRSELLESVIQTDAAINPGNSGGPLLNLSGEVIGVNVAMQRGAENIGFALPANTIKNIAESVKEHGEIIQPYLGVRYMQVTEALQEKNNLPTDYGALIVRGKNPEDLAVIPGSPADKAGIVENDIILTIDDTEIKDGRSLGFIIRQKNVGDTITLKILSKGKEKTVTATLEKVQ